jgi:hypothetical protein
VLSAGGKGWCRIPAVLIPRPGSPGKWFKKMSVSHPVNNWHAGAIFFGVTLGNIFDSLRVFSLRNFSLRRIFIV